MWDISSLVSVENGYAKVLNYCSRSYLHIEYICLLFIVVPHCCLWISFYATLNVIYLFFLEKHSYLYTVTLKQHHYHHHYQKKNHPPTKNIKSPYFDRWATFIPVFMRLMWYLNLTLWLVWKGVLIVFR